ncbi:hypothetical protein CO701_13550 [Citrobacter werkmanii]|nr:hypothetical protein CO701_13550 [Citrobacter werkmanii]
MTCRFIVQITLKTKKLCPVLFKFSVNTLIYWYTELASEKNALNLENRCLVTRIRGHDGKE